MINVKPVTSPSSCMLKSRGPLGDIERSNIFSSRNATFTNLLKMNLIIIKHYQKFLIALEQLNES